MRNTDYDVIISGGGLTGVVTALALAQAGFSALVIEVGEKPALTDPAYDGRNTALSQASFQMLETLEIAPLLAEAAQPINDILVSDGTVRGGASTSFLYFHHEFIGEKPLGYFIPNPNLRAAFINRAEALSDKVTLLYKTAMTDFEQDDFSVRVTLSDGKTYRAGALLNAEGKKSPLRDRLGIRVRRHAYGQKGIVTTVEHEKPHNGLAQEFFLPAGPFALLPLVGNRMSTVWTEPSERADALIKADDALFHHELRARFGDYLGEIKQIGAKFAYPLEYHACEKLVEGRAFLIGDSAHGIHPMAGQGFNLGLRDAATLAELMAEAKYTGSDFVGPAVARAYEARRRADILALGYFTGGMNALFSNNNPFFTGLRRAGLAAVNALPPVRNFFIRYATGVAGNRPKLMRGERL